MRNHLVIFLLILSACSPKLSPPNNPSIQGTWRNDDDSLWLVKFTKTKFYSIYNKDTSVYKYSRSSKSCDEKYMKEVDPNLDFFSLDDGRCFEITGLTDSALAYRHTATGRMHVFYRSF